MGFFLKTPPAFRAVARESCHLHTLDRVGMAAMQVRLMCRGPPTGRVVGGRSLAS